MTDEKPVSVELTAYEAYELHRVLSEREMHFGMNDQPLHAQLIKQTNRQIEDDLYEEEIFKDIINEENMVQSLIEGFDRPDREPYAFD